MRVVRKQGEKKKEGETFCSSSAKKIVLRGLRLGGGPWGGPSEEEGGEGSVGESEGSVGERGSAGRGESSRRGVDKGSEMGGWGEGGGKLLGEGGGKSERGFSFCSCS